MAQIKTIAVFCGSKHGVRPVYTAAAHGLAECMVQRNISLVYGGGTVGLMGEIATKVEAGLGPDHVLGVIPEALTPMEVSKQLIGNTVIVADMHERKAKMASLADGFIAMPGGFGTLEELLEVITWQQLGFHAKPIGLLNTDGFYNGLTTFFQHCTQEGFINAKHNNVLVASTPDALLDIMLSWHPPASNALADAKMRMDAKMMATAIGEDISKAST